MLGGTYRYTELLRGSDTPFVEDNTALSDFDGPTVEARGTANAGTIKLIQTYLSKEDTEKPTTMVTLSSYQKWRSITWPTSATKTHSTSN